MHPEREGGKEGENNRKGGAWLRTASCPQHTRSTAGLVEDPDLDRVVRALKRRTTINRMRFKLLYGGFDTWFGWLRPPAPKVGSDTKNTSQIQILRNCRKRKKRKKKKEKKTERDDMV